MTRTIGDMKQGLTGSRPALSILPRAPQLHECRVLEYGADKYARGNYHGAPPEGVSPAMRVLGYIDATMRHLARVANAANHALGTGGDVAAALSIVDDDGGGKFPASMLPDLSHAMTSLALGITVAVDDGILPMDPGQPWKAGADAGLPQKDDPASEKLRIRLAEIERSRQTSRAILVDSGDDEPFVRRLHGAGVALAETIIERCVRTFGEGKRLEIEVALMYVVTLEGIPEFCKLGGASFSERANYFTDAVINIVGNQPDQALADARVKAGAYDVITPLPPDIKFSDVEFRVTRTLGDVLKSEDFGKNQMPAEMVPELMKGQLAEDMYAARDVFDVFDTCQHATCTGLELCLDTGEVRRG